LSYKFLTENGGGLYFLNKYDPNKEIVLLVHGAKGNGVNWKYLINNLDKRFQPLIVSYPSGVNLNISANIITRKLENLFLKYKISNFNIIAHSMGGLVAKQIINNLNHNKYKINTFITLSTPWGGHEAATKTKDLPYSIPSWHDMIPNSEFIVNLKNKYNSLSVNHYLLFGYKGNSTIYSRDNDGVISLKSQLNYYDQVNAKKVYGFNETHISILQSDRVFNMINIILNDKLK
jgi:pimeloyl-ACP methyl ester carboxylesterase